MTHIKVISKKPVFKGRLLDVYEVELELPNGSKRIHHTAARPPTVSVLPVTDTGLVYLISQYRYLLESVSLEVMAGFVDKNETPLQAAKRELKEETGISASDWKKLAVIEMAGSVFRAQAYLFVAKEIKEGKATPEDDEQIDVVKIPLDTAVEKVLAGEINHSASVIAILMANELRKRGKL